VKQLKGQWIRWEIEFEMKLDLKRLPLLAIAIRLHPNEGITIGSHSNSIHAKQHAKQHLQPKHRFLLL